MEDLEPVHQTPLQQMLQRAVVHNPISWFGAPFVRTEPSDLMDIDVVDIEMDDAPPLDVEVELDDPMDIDPIDDPCIRFSGFGFSRFYPMDID